jgi:hypothetical protein
VEVSTTQVVELVLELMVLTQLLEQMAVLVYQVQF